MDMTTKYISVPNKIKREIQEIFGCSRVTVWSALNYKTTGDQAERIRKFAIDKGGVIFDESKQKFTNLNN
jgi:hypothetical protein